MSVSRGLLTTVGSCLIAVLACEGFLYLMPGLQPLGTERRHHCVGPEFKDAPDSIFFETKHEAEGWKLHINNAEGFRDIFDTGEIGIVALGDSFTRGAAVNNGEHYPDLLDAWMPDTGVRAYGFGGWGTGDVLVQYRKAATFPHRQVVLGYYVGNDLTDNIKAGFRLEDGAIVFPPETTRIPPEIAKDRPLNVRVRAFLRDNSRVYRLVRHVVLSSIGGGQTLAGEGELEGMLGLAEALLEALRAEVEARGARLLIVAIPSFNEISLGRETPDLTAQYALLERISASHDSVDLVDLRPAVAAETVGEVFAADGHMARLGQYLIARGAAGALGVTAPPFEEDAELRIRPDCARVGPYVEELGAYGPA